MLGLIRLASFGCPQSWVAVGATLVSHRIASGGKAPRLSLIRDARSAVRLDAALTVAEREGPLLGWHSQGGPYSDKQNSMAVRRTREGPVAGSAVRGPA